MVQKRLSQLFFFLIVAGSISACNKNKSCTDGVKGKFVDATGLDGCGMIIELNSGKKLEPKNLSEFDINIADNQKIRLKYHLTSGGSICMVGEIVEIDCIAER